MTSDSDASPDGEDLDEGTLFVRRGGVPTEPLADDEFDDATRRSRRPADDAGAPGIRQPAPEIDAETGSTMVVRRESRRRAEAAAREAAPDLDVTVAGVGVRPLPRQSPAMCLRRSVGVRSRRVPPTPSTTPAPPIPVAEVRRAPLPTRTPQAPFDGVAAEALARRRARRRAATVVVLASIVLITAVAAVIVLAFAG